MVTVGLEKSNNQQKFLTVLQSMEAAEQSAPVTQSRSLRCLNIDWKSDF